MKIVRANTKEGKRVIERIVNRNLEDKRLENKVKKIIEDVRKNGDRALLKYTKRFEEKK